LSQERTKIQTVAVPIEVAD